MCIITIPQNPKRLPNTASKIFSGRWPAIIPSSFNNICTAKVITIFDAPIAPVRAAPTRLKPTEYDNAPTKGSREKNIKIMIVRGACAGDNCDEIARS